MRIDEKMVKVLAKDFHYSWRAALWNQLGDSLRRSLMLERR